MSTIEYTLFRVKLVRPKQRSLLHDSLTARELLDSAIDERPSLEKSTGQVWHLGNVQRFTEELGYFAIGRTTTSTVEKFDQASGNFVEELLETSPYTHCVFDLSIGAIGIAKKTSLYQTAQGFANRLQELLSTAEIVRRNEIEVSVSPIPDPDGFLRAIKKAHAVTSFTAYFTGPNPTDADELFQKPLSVYLSTAGGSSGRTIIKGADLDREVVGSVARSVASTGNQASARIKDSAGIKPRTIHLKGDNVKLRYADDDHSLEESSRDLAKMYARVRSDAGD